MRRYFWNLLISLDQFVNTVFNGDPDETISSRVGKHVADGDKSWRYALCKMLHFFDKNHCEKSIEEDEGK
ncbi:MAG: hypothetical protein IBX43_05000 [Campylobacterales bacterium]|nr:hypothetical protein [Campylobacterales bacterium]